MNVISAGTNIFTAIVASPSNFTNGVNGDTDSDYLSRSATYLRSLSSTINKSSQLDSFVLSSFPGVIGRVRSYDLTNGNTTSGDITVSRTSGVIGTFRDGTTNIGTVRTEAPHLFIAGDSVRLSNCGPFSGDFEVLATSASTIVFTSVGSNSASTVVTGSAYAGEDDPGYVSVFAYGLNTQINEQRKLAPIETPSPRAFPEPDVESSPIITLDSPPINPSLPMTAGARTGAGAGEEGLGLPGMVPGAQIDTGVNALRAMYMQDPNNQDLRRMLEYVDNTGINS